MCVESGCSGVIRIVEDVTSIVMHFQCKRHIGMQEIANCKLECKKLQITSNKNNLKPSRERKFL
jgi:hypothetical protein